MCLKYLMLIVIPSVSLAESILSFVNVTTDYIQNENIFSIYINMFDPVTTVEGFTGLKCLQLFKYFHKVIIENLPDKDGRHLSVLSTILQEAAYFNRNNEAITNNLPVEIWIRDISFPKLNESLKLIQEANHIYPGTITALIWRFYSRQSYSVITAKSMHKQIQSIGPIDFGLMLVKPWEEQPDCLELLQLPLEHLDFVYYPMPKLPSYGSYENYTTCGLVEEVQEKYNTTKTKLGIASVGHPVFYNDTMKLVIVKKANSEYKILKHIANMYQLPIMYSGHTIFYASTDFTKICKSKEVFGKWIKQDNKISTKGLGISIAFDLKDFKWTENLLAALLAHTSSLHIQNENTLNTSSIRQMKKFFESLRAFVEKSKILDEKHYYKDVGVMIQLSDKDLSTTLFIERIVEVLLLSADWNSKVPGVIKYVTINTGDWNSDRGKLFDDIVKEIKQRIPSKKIPKLGARLNLGRYEHCRRKDIGNESEFVLLNYEVGLGSCRSKEEYIMDYNKEVQKCIAILNSVKEFKSHYSVRINGCYKRDKLEQVYELEKMLEAINLQAELTESTIFVNFPAQAFLEPNISSINSSQNTDCFYWRLVHDNQAETGYRIEDKKKVARNIFVGKYPGYIEELTTFQNALHPNQTLNLPIKNYKDWQITLGMFIAISIVTVLGVASVLVVLRYRYNYLIKEEELLAFFNGNSKQEDGHDEGTTLALGIKYNREKYEIPEKDFTIDMDKPLGFGEFGLVYKGTIKSPDNIETQVAVKTFKKRANSATSNALALKSLLREIKALSYVGNHNHIINLVGAYTEEIMVGRVYLFLEYCEQGSMHQLLSSIRKRKRLVQRNGSRWIIVAHTLTNSTEEMTTETLKLLQKWSCEICDGMQYLAFKKVVHSDLATRNVLLDDNFIAKISDFGFSRRLYGSKYYVMKQQEPLPWRWMAPELFHKREFCEKTDVWAFGITLWEIFSLGDTPYPDHTLTVEFPSLVENGLRMAIPLYSTPEQYNIMRTCWNHEPCQRPTFDQLKNWLGKHYDSSESVSIYDEVL